MCCKARSRYTHVILVEMFNRSKLRNYFDVWFVFTGTYSIVKRHRMIFTVITILYSDWLSICQRHGSRRFYVPLPPDFKRHLSNCLCFHMIGYLKLQGREQNDGNRNVISSTYHQIPTGADTSLRKTYQRDS